MKRKLNPPAEKWAMLPNETDFSIFTPTTPPKHFTFKALGSFSKIKGYDQLISAFAEVHKRYPNCRLVIGGYGKEEMRLKKLCKQLALTDCVTFPGKILLENRNAFYQNTSAFVCSSHTETFSVVIIEAFACGIPVIATECGGPEDLITSKNGYLVKRDNIASLTQGMIKMIENRQHFNGEEIRAQAAALYDIDIIIKKQIDCFNTAISRFPNKKEEK